MAAPSFAEAVRHRIDDGLRQIQASTGLPMVFGGPIVRSGVSDHLVIERLRGNLSPSLDGVRVERGQGLGGLVLAHARPFVVNDYQSNRAITHQFDPHVVQHERITSVFALPICSAGRVEAILYGASRNDGPIGDIAVRRAGSIATALAADVSRSIAAPRPVPAALTRAEALAELDAVAKQIADPALRTRLLRARDGLMRPDRSRDAEPVVPSLAPREEECLRLAAVGATNVQIAEQLGLSTETVKAYLRSAMRRLKVTNRTGAIHVARTAGLI